MAAALFVLVAHVGGIPTQALFERPVELGEVADTSATIVWRDNELDLTGLFDFYFQPSNIRPAVMTTHPDFAGALFAEAVPVSDPSDQLIWNSSAVSAGSYFIYEITRDPPLSPVFSVSPVPITVRHAGEPRWPAVVVTEPDGIMDTQQTRFAVKWSAAGQGTLMATIRYGTVGEDTLSEIVSGVPLVASDAERYEGCYLWNISLLAQGTYYVQVEVADEGGRTHTAFSRNSLVIYRNPDLPDAGVEPACEGTPSPPDSGSGTGDARTPAIGEEQDRGCACALARGGGPPLTSLTIFACAAVAALRPRARPRRVARRR